MRAKIRLIQVLTISSCVLLVLLSASGASSHNIFCCFTPPCLTPTTKDDRKISPSMTSSQYYSRKEEDEERRLPGALEAPIEDERRRTRHDVTFADHQQKASHLSDDWSVERYERPAPVFPDTVEAVTEAAFEAIAGTLYEKQRLDPNVVSNAMSSSVLGRRPTRSTRDAGRIGIEIDGATFLFPGRSEGNASAIRRVALVLASKLSRGHWEGFEEDDVTTTAEKDTQTSRPVALYFNTIKQALIASQELRLLRHEEKSGRHGQKNRCFENIHIFCLGQDNAIPKHMRRRKRLHGELTTGKVDPKRGLILVVQPTDYNREFKPPGPAVGAVTHLQQLVARASVEALPTIVLSPRFLAHEHHHNSGGWDQSGYQQSAAYGGDEPPRGPTPWVIRDFFPPVFAWVGNALALSSRRQRRHRSDESHALDFSRVVLSQSTMQEGHAWHMFAVKESDDMEPSSQLSYQYLASTKTSSGRPPRHIIQHVFDEWS